MGEGDKKILEGVPASAGVAEGQASVIISAKEQDKMVEGNILVVPFTTPEYIPSILKSSAIVTDRGTIMSHAAVIAREFGIPGVIGTNEATKIIKDYMEVIVDGSNGYVYKK